MENALVPVSVLETPDDAMLTSLVRKYEESEEATREAREKSERDRDYYDNKQLTQEEHDELVKRGQPPIVFNLIKSRVEHLQGVEKQQRRDPKAWPRNNPNDAQAADAFTDGMRYAISEADYETARSGAWKNITVEGYGGLEAWVEPAKDGNYNIKMKRIPWDRLFYDPHSCEPDFSDAAHLGQVLWMDEEEAVERGVNAGGDEEAIRRAVQTTLQPAGISETYDDKPRNFSWADRRRKRVRIIVMWVTERGQWTCYEFTKGGFLSQTPGPYVDQDGEPYCPLILESAHVDRDNNRYGEVRNLIDPQDETNKRRSKRLWMATTRGVIADEGAVADKEKTRRELARPDFYIEKMPDASFEVVTSRDMDVGQQQLQAEAAQYITQQAQNAALTGRGPQSQSGRAWEAQQSAGMIEQGDIMDTLRRLDHRVFRMVANMIKQFWTAEKWIRVTDDELAPKWVGLNVPQIEETPWGPQQVGVENNVAELEMDIIVSDAPDMVTLDGETYAAFTQLLSSSLPPPMLRLAIELHPGLSTKRKKQALDMLEQMAQQPQTDPEADAMAKERAGAETEELRARAFRQVAQGEAAVAKAQQPAPMMPAF